MKVCGCVLAALAVTLAIGLAGATQPVVVCYIGSWAVYRPGLGQFSINHLDSQLCTHVVYAFVGLNASTNQLTSLDPQYDIVKGAFQQVVNLKNSNPRLKVSVAVGGWTEGSAKYSAMAATSATRKIFIESVVAFLREYGFDGLDLDWEYPANRGGKPEDKQNFVLLCQELRRVFDRFGWLLTAAVSAGKRTIDTAYDLPGIAREVDLLHIMAYDYHGKWDGVTGHNAPLYPRDDETEAQKVLNVEFSVDYYLQKGVPAAKLVLGVGFYGRTFILRDATNPAIGAPAMKSAFAGPYTREDGFLGYNEICEKQVSEAGLWRVVWQKAHQAPYMFKKNQWVSFDDDNSIRLKVALARSRNLAGMMIWSVDTDDFRGRCGGPRFPLLVTINKALGRAVVDARPIDPSQVQPIAPPTQDIGPVRTPRPTTPDHRPGATRPGVPLPDVPDIIPMAPVKPGIDGDIDFELDYDNSLDRSRTSYRSRGSATAPLTATALTIALTALLALS